MTNNEVTALSNIPGNHCCNDSTHCGKITPLAVIRHPESSQTGPHKLRNIQESSQVHQYGYRSPWARVCNGPWETIINISEANNQIYTCGPVTGSYLMGCKK